MISKFMEVMLTLTLIILAVLLSVLFYLGMEHKNEPQVKAEPTTEEIQHRAYDRNITALHEKVEKLEDEVYRQFEEIVKLQRKLEMEEEQEELVASIIKREGKTSDEFATELARLIISINEEYEETYGFENDIPKMLSIIRVESTFNPSTVSYAGAKGLMQLMDSTGRPIAKKLGFESYNPHDPEQNIRVAWYYYNTDKERLGENKATVAYNQGYRNLEGALKKSMSIRASYWSKVKSFDDEYSSLLDGLSK